MSKQKRQLSASEKAEKKRRRREYMTIFINGKQKRVKRPPTIDGIPVDEFVRRNADPVWLLKNEMYEELDEGEHINSDGYFAVATAGGSWVVCSNRLDGQLVAPMSSNAFTRITLCQDLSTSPPTFAVFLDGGLVAQGLSSPANTTTYKSFGVNNDDQGRSAYLDDVAIQTLMPASLTNGVWTDLDHDGVPDALEIDRYGTTYKMFPRTTIIMLQ
jgi:hypothetical protein